MKLRQNHVTCRLWKTLEPQICLKCLWNCFQRVQRPQIDLQLTWFGLQSFHFGGVNDFPIFGDFLAFWLYVRAILPPPFWPGSYVALKKGHSIRKARGKSKDISISPYYWASILDKHCPKINPPFSWALFDFSKKITPPFCGCSSFFMIFLEEFWGRSTGRSNDFYDFFEEFWGQSTGH